MGLGDRLRGRMDARKADHLGEAIAEDNGVNLDDPLIAQSVQNGLQFGYQEADLEARKDGSSWWKFWSFSS